jgi:hypothetical protein
MRDDVDIDGNFDYFFNSKEWEKKHPEKLLHLKSIPIFEDAEFATVCKQNPEISL